MTYKHYSYSMALNADLVIGSPREFSVRDWTMRSFNPVSIISNMPSPDFLILDEVVVDGIMTPPFYSQERGRFSRDAFDFSASNEKRIQRFEPMVCIHGVRMTGRYSGLIPIGYESGAAFLFCLTLQGSAS